MESLENLKKGFHHIDTENIKTDPSMQSMFNRNVQLVGNVDMLELAEGFLCIFEEREAYELCDRIIKKYPELNNDWHNETSK